MPSIQCTSPFSIFILTLLFSLIFSCSKDAVDMTIPETVMITEEEMTDENTDAVDNDSEQTESDLSLIHI